MRHPSSPGQRQRPAAAQQLGATSSFCSIGQSVLSILPFMADALLFTRRPFLSSLSRPLSFSCDAEITTRRLSLSALQRSQRRQCSLICRPEQRETPASSQTRLGSAAQRTMRFENAQNNAQRKKGMYVSNTSRKLRGSKKNALGRRHSKRGRMFLVTSSWHPRIISALRHAPMKGFHANRCAPRVTWRGVLG